MTKEINGVQKKVVQALRKNTFLGFYSYGDKPKKSNKELQQELNEPPSNISYATNQLKDKDIIKDTTGVFEGDKTAFMLQEGVEIDKRYDFDTIIDNTALVHAASAIMVFLYTIILAQPIYTSKGLFLTVFLAGLTGLMPSFFYNLYQIWTSLDSYKLLIELSE